MVRLGVVGCGGISKTHVAGFKKLGPGMRVTAGVDIDFGKARAFAGHFRGCRPERDYDRRKPC